MATCIKGSGELECECLRTAATACPDDVQDSHTLMLPWSHGCRSSCRVGGSVPRTLVIRLGPIDRRVELRRGCRRRERRQRSSPGRGTERPCASLASSAINLKALPISETQSSGTTIDEPPAAQSNGGRGVITAGTAACMASMSLTGTCRSPHGPGWDTIATACRCRGVEAPLPRTWRRPIPPKDGHHPEAAR